MKKILFIILIFITFTLKSQVKEGFQIPKDAKIGLSLSGGGAKGFAHIGALKILDSLGVKVDYIAGTSMGAIVGGLYASGYTGKDIEKIILDTDFYTLIANEKNRQESSFFNKANDKYLLNIPVKEGKFNVVPKAISTGQKNIYILKELFKNVANINDFSELPIPFMCVVTNLESGNMKVLERGDLIKSIMASSAYPGLMDPVKIGDSLYIDGAMTINYPSKPLKDKGMDIVIGVDLNQPLSTREQLNSAVTILNQVIDFGIQKDTKKQYKYTDINIKPDLMGISATNYGDKEKILFAGYDEAKKYADILSNFPKRDIQILRAPNNPIFSNTYKIDSLIVENTNIYGENYIKGKINLKIPSIHTYHSINQMIDKLYATNNYNLINYDIIQENNKNILKLYVNENDTRFSFKFGLHYDRVFKTGLLINSTVKRLLFRNSTISFDGVVGDKPRYYFNYFIDNGYIPGFGLYASGMKFDLFNKNSEIKENWTWFRNEAFIQSVWKEKYAIGGGISYDFFKAKDITNFTKNKEHYLNPYIFIKSDTRDDKDFPTKGIYINAEGKLLDIFSNESEDKNLLAKADVRINIPINNWYSNRLKLFGGLTLGDNTNSFYNYRMGGIFEQNLGNFVNLYGYQFGQEVGKNVLITTNEFQFKVQKNLFLIPNITIVNDFNNINITDILNIKYTTIGLTTGYKSPFGQIKFNYSKSLTKGNPGLFTVVLGHWF